jgi:hypothetical protein
VREAVAGAMNMVVTNHLASYYNVDGKAGVNAMIKKAGFAKKFPALYAVIEGMFVEKVVLNVHLERNNQMAAVVKPDFNENLVVYTRVLSEVILATIPSSTVDVVKRTIGKYLVGAPGRKGGIGRMKSASRV